MMYIIGGEFQVIWLRNLGIRSLFLTFSDILTRRGTRPWGFLSIKNKNLSRHHYGIYRWKDLVKRNNLMSFDVQNREKVLR